MATQTLKAMKKSLQTPDEIRQLSNGELRLATVGDVTFGLVTLQPGWKWSKDLAPVVGTKSCQATHTQYIIRGRLAVLMDDGMELELQAGDCVVVPAGHDAWVVGDEPVVAIDFTGMKEYARKTEMADLEDPGGWMELG